MAGRRTYHVRACVIGRTKLGETDLILTLLAADGRQLRAVAKGARRPGGRLAARVELFCLADAHPHLRGDYERVAAASAVCEVARLTCFEGAEDPFLFAILHRALTACEQACDQAHLDLAVAAYAMKVLAHAGWRPELEACCACGDPAPTRFSPTAGGMLCESCAKDVAGAQEVTPSQAAWLRALLLLTFDELMGAPVDPQCAVWLLGVAHLWCATHLDARLRAMEFALSA